MKSNNRTKVELLPYSFLEALHKIREQSVESFNSLEVPSCSINSLLGKGFLQSDTDHKTRN